MTAWISVEDIENLKHMLGATKNVRRNSWGYRNHFVVDTGSADYRSMERLLRAGLARKFSVGYDGMPAYCATRKGAELIGIPKTKMKELGLLKGQKDG